MTLHLRTISLKRREHAGFPWSVPALRSFVEHGLEFTTPITFFIGENGSGKSTLLEAIALAAGSINVGSDQLERDDSLAALRPFANALKLSWRKRTRRGFFMRSEDFFGYARRMHALRTEAEAEYRALQADPKLSPTARAFGSLPSANTVHALQQRYGAGLDSYSHGESFFTLFRSRFVPDGLYLLDEPEAPLSPRRQLALIAMLKQMVNEQGAQFIIATHSPILMAMPDAVIYSFDAGTLQPIAYDDVDHVRFTRDFLNHPQAFLHHL